MLIASKWREANSDSLSIGAHPCRSAGQSAARQGIPTAATVRKPGTSGFTPTPRPKRAGGLTIDLPEHGVLVAQDILYNKVHLFIGDKALDAWNAAIAALEARPYDVILPGHGLPGDRRLYNMDRACLASALTAYAEADGPDDLNERLEAAFPDYGGTALQGLPNFYLFPAQR